MEEDLRNISYLKEYIEIRKKYPPTYGGSYKGIWLGIWTNRIRGIFLNGIQLKNGDIKHGSSILSKEVIDELNAMHFIWIAAKTRIYKEEFNEVKYNGIRRYLKEELNRQLEEYDNEITEENLEKIRDNFQLILRKQNTNQ